MGGERGDQVFQKGGREGPTNGIVGEKKKQFIGGGWGKGGSLPITELQSF